MQAPGLRTDLKQGRQEVDAHAEQAALPQAAPERAAREAPAARDAGAAERGHHDAVAQQQVLRRDTLLQEMLSEVRICLGPYMLSLSTAIKSLDCSAVASLHLSRDVMDSQLTSYRYVHIQRM